VDQAEEKAALATGLKTEAYRLSLGASRPSLYNFRESAVLIDEMAVNRAVLQPGVPMQILRPDDGTLALWTFERDPGKMEIVDRSGHGHDIIRYNEYPAEVAAREYNAYQYTVYSYL